MRQAPIRLVAHDPRWAAAFAAERRLLQTVLQPWLAGEIEHVGSTAVAGLAAKPVIDVMAPVHTLAASRPAIAALEVQAGYVHHPYQAEVMHWFCKPSPEHRTHHLHLVPRDSALWTERLAFRDALREDPALRQAYARLKHDLARQYEHDREAYTDAKTPFIRAALQAVRGGGGAA